jgi:hypothetical protein
MKLVHNTRGWKPDRTDSVWAERVEREAERITDQTEARWHKAQRRLARAIEKAEAAEQTALLGPTRLRRLWQAVDVRRGELLAIERLMTQSPAGSQHRGKGSHRGVSTGEAL